MPTDLLPYQEEGATYVAGRDRCGLHDEMGVGKTAQIIRAIELTGSTRGIVVCPAMLRENWIGEFRKFSRVPLRLCKGQTIHDYWAWQRGAYQVLITSYELAVKWSKHVIEQGEILDFVAMDEAHYIKNPTAQRTRAILGFDLNGFGGSLIEFAQHIWHVTGTPMANDPLDIYTFLRMCHATDMSREAFVRRYFHKVPTRFGSRQQPRDEMVPELQYLIQNNSIRRTKKDVGLQLPPIFLTSVLVDGDTSLVRQMLSEHPDLERAIVKAVELGGLSFLEAQHIGTLRRLIGEAKAVPYSHMLLDEIRAYGEKRVVFGIHRDALIRVRDFMWKHNIKAVLVNGDTPERDRIEAVRAFQNDDDCLVFIGNMRAAGVGLTLTAACEMDVFESDWSPAGNAQAIMRVHRIGQTRNVQARFITLARSIDEVVNRIVADKTAAIAQVEGEAMTAAPALDDISAFI